MNRLQVILVAALASSAALVSSAAWAADPAPAPAGATTAETDRMQEMICRKDKETGSLVKAKKTCHTRSQWQYVDDTNQQMTRDLIENTRTKSTGN